LKDKVIEIVSKAAKLEPSYLMENTSENLWDSLKHLEIIFLLEEAFDIRLETDDIAAMRSIDVIMEILLRIQDGKK
jgi:acyl carrier protein